MVLCPLILLLFIWWPLGVIIGGGILLIAGVALLFLFGGLSGGVPVGQSMFSLDRSLSTSYLTSYLTSNLEKVEAEVINMFSSEKENPTEDYRRRFLVASNAIDPHLQIIPDKFYCHVSNKILYEYRRKTGSLRYRLGSKPVVSSAEVMRRLTDEERTEYVEFCKKGRK